MHITNEKSCRLWVTIVSLLVLLPIFSYAQTQRKGTTILKYGSHHDGKRHDPAMNKWRDDRFGQFIHFGLYSVLGGSWRGKHYDGAAEWIKQWAHIPDSSYDSLIHQFDPVDFNATKWAAIAKQMGAKFVIVTTKHHEGFCLWPSKYTNFDLASTPYKKDIIGEIVKAYNKAGIDVYLYYSILDWHHKDWRYDIKSKADSLAFDKYKQYVKDQLTELLERYPTIKGFWFDGTWDNSWKKNGKFSYELEQYLKKLHPGLIIDSRLRADDYGSRHFDSNGKLMGDYYDGFERKLPPVTDTAVMKYDWECVMTIPENQWGYNAIWTGHVKTPDEIIEMMAHTVSMGGDFVLNFGPKPDGTFRLKEREIAKSIGDWIRVNGAAIYGCDDAKGWEKEDWGFYTSDTAHDKVYMIIFNTPVSGALKIKPPKGVKVIKDFPITQPDHHLKMEYIDQGQYLIHLDKTDFHHPYVIELQVENENYGEKSNYSPPKT